MGGSPKIKTPPVSPPMALPEVAIETPEEAMKKAKRRSGFAKTILAGNLSPMSTGKKTTLG